MIEAAVGPFPPAFLEGLRRLARVFERYAARAGRRPVLVGGAAASLHTGGAIVSGDFDVVAAADEVFEAAMLAEGFRREDRAGFLRFGFYHPEVPSIGVQQVTGPLFDGRTDPLRLVVLPVPGEGAVQLPPVEDLIADRLAQFAATGERDLEMLEQARLLRELADGIDEAYLRKRISEEGGDPRHLGPGWDARSPAP